MDYISSIDIFNRSNLIGDQSITTINSFNDYLDSLLSPFNDVLTQMLLEVESISLAPITTYTTKVISNLQVTNNDLLNKYTLINNTATITSDSNDYITDLNTTKTVFTTLLNNKALSTTPLTRPTLATVLATNNSAVNKRYISTVVTNYILPTPIPNTKLYVNKEGTGYIWA
jgi:hypothetical protein